MLDLLSFHLDHRKADIPPNSNIDRGSIRSALWSGEWADRLSSSRLLENIYLVAVGLRRASFFHPLDEREVLLVRGAAEKVGVGMAVRKAGGRVLKVYLYGEGGEAVTKVPDVDESLGRMEFITAQIALANMTGQLMEYPSCCVSSFVGHLMNGSDQDEKATSSLRSISNPSPDAYFLERFVPCSPNCKNAERMGRQLGSLLTEISPDLGDTYSSLKLEHMEEVRSGRILKEKRERDSLISDGVP